MVDSPNSSRWRFPAAIFSVITGSLLLILAIATVWLHSIVFNTDRFVAIAESLIANQAVVDSLADTITTRLFDKIDAEKILQDRLPDRIKFLAVPLTAELRTFVNNEAHKLIGSDEFQNIWVQANQVLHTYFIKFLRGETEVFQLNDSKIILDLGAVGDRLRARLEARGINIFDNISLDRKTEIVLFESKELQKVQSYLVLLDRLYLALPILVLLCFGLAIAVSPQRLTALMGIGLGIACSMVVLGLVLYYGRPWWLDVVKGGNLTPEAAGAIYDTIILGLRDAVLWLFATGIVVSLIAVVLDRVRTRAIVIHG